MGKRAEQTINLVVVGLVIFFWPLNFLTRNSVKDTIHFFLPSILIFCAITLFKERFFKRNILLFSIPFLNNSLLLIPMLSLLYKSKKLGYLILAIIIAIGIFFAGQSFLGSSIFYFEHNDQQKVIRQGYLYPNIYLARLFQNKPTIYLDRFWFNFFSLIDLNNYFFGFHPRQIPVENQNIQKFPFMSIFLFLGGIYLAIKKQKQLLFSVGWIVINLALLKNFDKSDAVLWLLLCSIIYLGLEIFKQITSHSKYWFLVIFILFSLTEYLRMIVSI